MYLIDRWGGGMHILEYTGWSSNPAIHNSSRSS